jgi:hypothetical protein
MHNKRLDDIEAVADRLINDGWKPGEDSPRLVGNTYREFAAEIRRLQETLEIYKPQPIETAPKDGTQVLLFSSEVRMGILAIYAKKKRKPGWYGPYGFISFGPTHWLPLPTLKDVQI